MNKDLKRIGFAIFGLFARFGSLTDRLFLSSQVPSPRLVAHRCWREYLYELGNREGARVLEIGSREVTGPSVDRMVFSKAEYVGFDFYPGKNVDIVGDVHKLSSYFPDGKKFDLIYTSACFEHFVMPWIAALEIAKMLKVGGFLFVETHFSFSSHERPWHFFHFSELGLKALFPPALGIECIDAGMSNPIIGRFSALADPYLRFRPINALYCHSEFLGRKVRDVVDSFDWREVEPSEIVSNTEYPRPR